MVISHTGHSPSAICNVRNGSLVFRSSEAGQLNNGDRAAGAGDPLRRPGNRPLLFWGGLSCDFSLLLGLDDQGRSFSVERCCLIGEEIESDVPQAVRVVATTSVILLLCTALRC